MLGALLHGNARDAPERRIAQSVGLRRSGYHGPQRRRQQGSSRLRGDHPHIGVHCMPGAGLQPCHEYVGARLLRGSACRRRRRGGREIKTREVNPALRHQARVGELADQ